MSSRVMCGNSLMSRITPATTLILVILCSSIQLYGKIVSLSDPFPCSCFTTVLHLHAYTLFKISTLFQTCTMLSWVMIIAHLWSADLLLIWVAAVGYLDLVLCILQSVPKIPCWSRLLIKCCRPARSWMTQLLLPHQQMPPPSYPHSQPLVLTAPITW